MADREPSSTSGCLDDVHPGTLPQSDHAQHDRWLVVRFASHDDDLTPAEATTVGALLASCRDCAALAADITTISHATAVFVAPVRHRDFRLTPAQAATAHGGVLDRLARWLASPRATVLRPLAGASLAIGIVLVVVSPTVRGPIQPPVQPPAAEAGAPGSTPSADPVLTMQLLAPKPSADAATNPEMMDTRPNASDSSAMTTSGAVESPDAQGMSRVAKSTPEPDTTEPSTPEPATASGTPEPRTADIQVSAGPSPKPGTATDGSIQAQRRSADATTTALTLLGIVLAGTGILVLLLTWLVRRMTRDPLLPG